MLIDQQQCLGLRLVLLMLDFFIMEGNVSLVLANVAQSVEQLTRNEQVVRSIRIVGSTFRSRE